MKNINIPEPCSENWNEMTPTQKGAFCQKCALDVYDFTNKSDDEIRDILTLNIGTRVCGRIESKQLNSLNEDFSAWQMTNKRSYQRAWVFTLFVVFGMTLFSCEEDEIPAVKNLQKTTQTILNNPQNEDIVEVGELIVPDYETTTGEIEKDKKSEIKTEIVEIIEVDVPFEDDIVGTMEWFEEPVNDVVIPDDLRYPTQFIQGAMISTHRYEVALIDSNLQKACDENKLSGLIYPNPASNETTLKVNMPIRGKAEIELFGLNGQKIKTIHNGRVRKGESEYQIDVSDLETGIYLVVILVDGKKETVKFSKI